MFTVVVHTDKRDQDRVAHDSPAENAQELGFDTQAEALACKAGVDAGDDSFVDDIETSNEKEDGFWVVRYTRSGDPDQMEYRTEEEQAAAVQGLELAKEFRDAEAYIVSEDNGDEED